MSKKSHNAFLNEPVPGLPFVVSPNTADSPFRGGKLRFETFLEISEEYKKQYGYSLVYCDNQGELIYGLPECCVFPCDGRCMEFRRIVLEEALNSGRPVSHMCGECQTLWGVPVMLNNTLIGGLVVVGAPPESASRTLANKARDVELACLGLLSLAVKFNIVNVAYLENRRDKLLRRDGFSRPNNLQTDRVVSKMQEFLSQGEPELLEHIRNGDQVAARGKLEEIVPFLATLPKDHLCLAKGFVLDLTIAMDRASMEAGTDFSTLMRFNCSSSVEIYQIESTRALSEFLMQALDQTFKIISPYHKKKNDVTLKNILSYLEKNFSKNISRETLAARFGISVSHLSHLLSQKMGRTFVEILNQYRSDRAAQMLVTVDLPIVEISAECGFQDQSYFGKVFRSHYGISPGRYRKEKTRSANKE